MTDFPKAAQNASALGADTSKGFTIGGTSAGKCSFVLRHSWSLVG